MHRTIDDPTDAHRARTLGLLALCTTLLTSACGSAPPPPTGDRPTAPSELPASPLVQSFADEAERLRPQFVGNTFVTRFLDEARRLPARPDRTVLVDGAPRTFDEEFYYAARWGTPLAYARALDLATTHGARSTSGARWLDFGFGAPGHLQMLGRLGLDVTGVDVDAPGRSLYTDPSDFEVAPGRLRLAYGHWPRDPATREAVGRAFDVVIAKNVLKRGHIHPARDTGRKPFVDLQVDDATFLGALHDALNPGGLVVVWNLCARQNPPDLPYIPAADGQNPFAAAAWEAAGFELLAYDSDDTERARELARALRFDAPDPEGGPAWDIEHDLRAWYSIARRR